MGGGGGGGGGKQINMFEVQSPTCQDSVILMLIAN